MHELIEKYGIIGTVFTEEQDIPIIGVPMMSDEKWQRMAKENAVHNFTRENGREPVDMDEAVQWQRDVVRQMVGEAV